MSALLKAIHAAALDSVRQEDDGLKQRFRFPQHFVGFGGHFPDMPVLPAVAQLLTAASVVGAHLKQDLRVAQVSKAKFLLPIRPDMEIEVQATQRQDDAMAWSVRLVSDQGPAASFLLTLAPAARDLN